MASTMSATAVESATTAVEAAASAVESATTAVEAAASATVEATAASRLEAAASPAAKPSAALRSEVPPIREPSSIEAPSIEAPAVEAAAIKSPVKESTSTESTIKKEAATEPRTRTDEDAIYEVIRSPITVRGASVWGIRVVAIGADRRSIITIVTVIAATYSNSYLNLRVRVTRRKHTNRQ